MAVAVKCAGVAKIRIGADGSPDGSIGISGFDAEASISFISFALRSVSPAFTRAAKVFS